MPRSRALTFGVMLAAGLAVAGTTAGVTYAAMSTSPKVVYACASKAGTLQLLNKGKCAKGYAKVAINKQGPRGITGPRGATGAKGATGPRGPQGPGALTLAVASTANGVSAQKAVALSTLNLDAGVDCNPGTAAAFSIGFHPGSTPTDWKISGLSYSTSPGYSLKVNGVSFVGANGSWGFDKAVDGFSGNGVRISVATGYRVQASLLLVRDGRSAAVELALDALDNDACSARAQITPSD